VLGRRQQEPFDPHELGARRSDPTLAALEPIPDLPRSRWNGKNLLAYFVLGVVIIAFVRDGVGRPAPVADGSCTKPAFVLDQTEVRLYGVIRWSAAGPAGSSVVFGIDTSSLPSGLADGKLAGPLPLEGCRATGRFGVGAPLGDHVVTVFNVARDGRVTTVGTEKITVNPR
jgi:hypothetical protein